MLTMYSRSWDMRTNSISINSRRADVRNVFTSFTRIERKCEKQEIIFLRNVRAWLTVMLSNVEYPIGLIHAIPCSLMHQLDNVYIQRADTVILKSSFKNLTVTSLVLLIELVSPVETLERKSRQKIKRAHVYIIIIMSKTKDLTKLSSAQLQKFLSSFDIVMSDIDGK